jgi:hypothetical protein
MPKTWVQIGSKTPALRPKSGLSEQQGQRIQRDFGGSVWESKFERFLKSTVFMRRCGLPHDPNITRVLPGGLPYKRVGGKLVRGPTLM